jgi:nucleotide-binding universal stress UspA family protein
MSIKTILVYVPSERHAAAGEGILAGLGEDGCDLLIMGGYGHSRFREMVFGGASRDILRDTLVPTLVSHGAMPLSERRISDDVKKNKA